jgi:N6-L-threonylcarbamoyladenine synthase
MEAHALMGRMFDSDIKYPFLTLLISGGHCLLALVESPEKFYRLGESVDISPGL